MDICHLTTGGVEREHGAGQSTHYGLSTAAFVIMLIRSALLLVRSKRRGWW